MLNRVGAAVGTELGAFIGAKVGLFVRLLIGLGRMLDCSSNCCLLLASVLMSVLAVVSVFPFCFCLGFFWSKKLPRKKFDEGQ